MNNIYAEWDEFKEKQNFVWITYIFIQLSIQKQDLLLRIYLFLD